MSRPVAEPSRAARLVLAMQQWPDPVVAVDAQARIAEWNPAAEEMFGWSAEEIVGRALEVLVPADRLPVLRRRLAALRRGERVAPFETVGLHRDGSRRWVRVQATPVEEDGSYAGAVAVLQDLSHWQAHRHHVEHVLAALPVVVAAFDDDGVVTLAAGGGYLRAGVLPALAEGTRLLDAAPAGSGIHRAVEDVLRAGQRSDLVVEFDDRVWQCHVTAVPDPEDALPARAPACLGGVLSAVDVTDLRLVTDRLDEVLSVSPICVAVFDPRGTITYAAGSGYRALGIEPEATVGGNMLALYGENQAIAQAVEQCLQGKAVDLVTEFGDRVWDLHYRPYPDARGGVSGGIAIGHDQTPWLHGEPGTDAGADSRSRPAVPELLVGFLERDDVTGELGRRGLARRLREPVPADQVRCVAVLDVDGFTALHNSYGIEVTDEVLRGLARRFRPLVAGAGAAFGRWHADEFMLVVDSARAVEVTQDLCQQLLDVAREPITIGSATLHVALSIGVADSLTSDENDLTAPARQALDVVRRRGGDDLARFEPGVTRTGTLAALPLTHDLRAAVADGGLGQFVLHFQPIVELSTQRVVGAEALVRWQHPRFGLLTPDRFIETAESTGLIEQLGAQVLDQACQAAVPLTSSSSPLQFVAVNLSMRQLTHPGLQDEVSEALRRHACPPEAIVLEVTETAVAADLEHAVRTLKALKRLGVRLALDDFGTGYSSLLHLKHFPIDTLKIDKTFVAGFGTDADDSAIVAATVSLAATLQVRCVAEGIETMDQLRLLEELGCGFGQGYLFSRPLPLAAFASWLDEHSGATTGGARTRRTATEAPEHVARVLAMHHDGASIHTIAASLNSHGARTAKGSRWSATAVARVIAASRFPQLHLDR